MTFIELIIANLHIVIAVIFLAILSVWDIKTYKLPNGSIPAALTTLFLIVIFVLNQPLTIVSAIGGLLFGLLLIDWDLFEGVADLKVFIALAMTTPTIMALGVFTVIMLVISLLIKFVIKKKFPHANEMPFIPVFFIAYLIHLVGSILL